MSTRWIRASVEARIAEAIAEDPDLAERLRNDPRASLSELLSVEIPDTVHITIHEETLSDVHLTIPARELTPEMLTHVAGGMAPPEDTGWDKHEYSSGNRISSV